MTPPFVRRYFIALGRYKWFGFASFVVVCGASGVVAIQPDPNPSFLAEMLLASNQPAATFSKTGENIQKQGTTISKEFLLSSEVIRKTAETTKQNQEEIRNKSEVYLPTEPDAPPIVRVHYKAPNPETASSVVEALAKAMVDYSYSVNSSRVRAIIDEINKRLPQVTEELEGSQQQLQQFEQVEGAALSMARIGALPGAIASVQEQQRQLRLSIEGIDAQIRSLSGRLGLTPAQAYVSQALSADPLIADLRARLYQTESQIEYYRQELRADHPQMVELQNQKQALDTLLAQRTNEVIGGNGVAAPLSDAQIRQNSSLDPARQQLASSLVSLQTERERLQQQFTAAMQTEQDLRQEYATIPNKQLERDRLQQKVAIQKTIYDQMQAALADAKAAEAEIVSNINVVPQSLKVKENTKQNLPIPLTLMAGGILGLGIGGVLVFLLSMLDGKYYIMEEIRNALQEREIPIWGFLPNTFTDDPRRYEMPIILAAHSPYLEAYERLRTNLRRSSEVPVKMVLLTSAGRKEGKTFCSYNLAIASARAGKRTLLIEADLRSPSQVQFLSVAPDPDAAIEPLRYYSQLNNCIRLVPDIENLYVIPSPGPLRNAGAILESSEMQRCLQDVRGRFDFVIIDTPSLSSCNDALLLEPLTDGLLLVTRPIWTESALMSEYVDSLIESEDARVIGAVINGVQTAAELYTETSIPESTPSLSTSSSSSDSLQNSTNNGTSEPQVPLVRRR
jgi:capsular exopolysaccharide synthesis family protein